MSLEFFGKIAQPMTLEEAKNLKVGQGVYLLDVRNRDGTAGRARVSGKVQTWKRDPRRVKVPYKRGMYEYGYITERDLHSFSVNEPAPLGESPEEKEQLKQRHRAAQEALQMERKAEKERLKKLQEYLRKLFLNSPLHVLGQPMYAVYFFSDGAERWYNDFLKQYADEYMRLVYRTLAPQASAEQIERVLGKLRYRFPESAAIKVKETLAQAGYEGDKHVHLVKSGTFGKASESQQNPTDKWGRYYEYTPFDRFAQRWPKDKKGTNTHYDAEGGKYYSYNTVIAQWLPDGKLIINITKYSSTTSGHQLTRRYNYNRAIDKNIEADYFVDNQPFGVYNLDIPEKMPISRLDDYKADKAEKLKEERRREQREIYAQTYSVAAKKLYAEHEAQRVVEAEELAARRAREAEEAAKREYAKAHIFDDLPLDVRDQPFYNVHLFSDEAEDYYRRVIKPQASQYMMNVYKFLRPEADAGQALAWVQKTHDLYPERAALLIQEYMAAAGFSGSKHVHLARVKQRNPRRSTRR